MEFTEEEGKKVLEAFKALGVKSKADSADTLQHWMVEHLKGKGMVTQAKHESQQGSSAVKDGSGGATLPGSHNPQWPRLSTFSGEAGSKTDASFDLWRYEVTCILEGQLHPEESIRQAIRRSLKGQAARVAMHLGPTADSEDILGKLEGVYGSVEVGQALLSEFYAARQKKGEDVVSWGCRLEDMMDRAERQGLVPEEKANEMLRTQFWTNLNQRLKDSSRHKFDVIQDFDKLRLELRSIEREYKVTEAKDEEEASKSKRTQSQRATGTLASSSSSSENESVHELKGIIHKLTGQMESMQQQMHVMGQAHQQQTCPPYPSPSVGRDIAPFPGMPGPLTYPNIAQQQHMQGPSGPPRFQASGPGSQPQGGRNWGPTNQGPRGEVPGGGGGIRNPGQGNFYPQSQNMVGNGCFKCGQVGHYKWECPMRNEGIVCYACHQPGHAKRECPHQSLNMQWPPSQGRR